MPFEVVYIKTRDKVSLHAYFIRHPEQKGSIVPTFVYFHGNAGNIGGRLQNCYGIYHNLQCNILLVGEFSSTFLIAPMTQRTKFNLRFLRRIPRLRIVRGCAEWKRPLHWRACCHWLFVYTTRPRPLTNCALRTKLGWRCGKKSAVMENWISRKSFWQVIDVAADANYGSKVMCAVVENTFSSIPHMARHLISYVKFIPLICHKNRVSIVKSSAFILSN